MAHWVAGDVWVSYGLRCEKKRARTVCKGGKGQLSLRKGHPCLALTHFKERTFHGPVRASRMLGYADLTVPKTKDAKQGGRCGPFANDRAHPCQSHGLRPQPQVAATQVTSNESQGTGRGRRALRALAAPFETRWSPRSIQGCLFPGLPARLARGPPSCLTVEMTLPLDSETQLFAAASAAPVCLLRPPAPFPSTPGPRATALTLPTLCCRQNLALLCASIETSSCLLLRLLQTGDPLPSCLLLQPLRLFFCPRTGEARILCQINQIREQRPWPSLFLHPT